MPDLPVMLRIAGRRCVVVGGGRVAHRRAAALLDAGGHVVVIAPDISPDLAALPVTTERRPYQAGDLAGALLVVIATNDGATNARIARDARDAGVLANRADAPDAGDLSIPAHAHHGPITLAVHTGGISAAAAAAIRRELSGAMDADWPRLLELVAPYRSKIQAAFTDGSHRTDRLTRLADADAMDTLKQHGPDALLARCESLLNPHIAVSHSSEACR